MIFFLEVDGVLRKCKVHGNRESELHFLNNMKSSLKPDSEERDHVSERIKLVAREIVESGCFEVYYGS